MLMKNVDDFLQVDEANTSTIRTGTLKSRMQERIPVDIATCMVHMDQVHHTILSMRDARERITHEKALLDAVAARTNFLSSMSHEIRSPLHGIIGYTDLLASIIPLTNVQRNYLGFINTCCSSIKRLVDDVLLFSRLNVGKLDVCPEEFALTDLTVPARNMANILSRDYSLQYQEIVLIDDKTVFTSDLEKIKQIVMNLVNNAFKFTLEGGVTITYGIEAKYLTVDVTDTGIGISPEKQPELFAMFSRVHDHNNHPQFPGTGLGLSISKKLTELLDGTLTCTSAGQGKGCTFSLKVPMTVEMEAYSTRIDNEEGSLQRCSNPDNGVLVVEDNYINLMIVERMLEQLGVTYDTARNGQEVVDIIERGETYSIIFMDYIMPVLDGVETTKILRARGYDKPIVAMSASAFNTEVHDFYAAGMNDALLKPFRIDDLREMIEKWI
jgi:signal transduction histidine kinase/CheY-like chemotaxis protein